MFTPKNIQGALEELYDLCDPDYMVDMLVNYGNVILPFIDRFPTDLELYRIMTTKLNEVAQEKEA